MREAGAILTAALASQGEDEEVHAAGKAARRTTVFDEPEVGAVYVSVYVIVCLSVCLPACPPDSHRVLLHNAGGQLRREPEE